MMLPEAGVVRTQLQLEEAQLKAIRRLAQRRRISISEAVRRLLDAGLKAGLASDQPGSGAEELLAIAGIGHSGLQDLGRRHDNYLDEDLQP